MNAFITAAIFPYIIPFSVLIIYIFPNTWMEILYGIPIVWMFFALLCIVYKETRRD